MPRGRRIERLLESHFNTGTEKTERPSRSHDTAGRLSNKLRVGRFRLPGRAMSDITRILKAIEQGDSGAIEQFWPLVYEELRRLASAQLARERPGQTLDVTALVHEAYLRLEVDREHPFDNRRHFFAAAARAMRQILVDSARAARGAGSGAADDAESSPTSTPSTPAARPKRSWPCTRLWNGSRPSIRCWPDWSNSAFSPGSLSAKRLSAWTSPSPLPTAAGGTPARGFMPR